jgi:hypothetical protein
MMNWQPILKSGVKPDFKGWWRWDQTGSMFTCPQQKKESLSQMLSSCASSLVGPSYVLVIY